MTSMIDKYDSIIKLYGIQNYTKIKESKILIVGAGGIGCEVNEWMNKLHCMNNIHNNQLLLYRYKMMMFKSRLIYILFDLIEEDCCMIYLSIYLLCIMRSDLFYVIITITNHQN